MTTDGSTSITVTGTETPSSEKIWVIPNFLPINPFVIIFLIFPNLKTVT